MTDAAENPPMPETTPMLMSAITGEDNTGVLFTIGLAYERALGGVYIRDPFGDKVRLPVAAAPAIIDLFTKIKDIDELPDEAYQEFLDELAALA